MAAFDRGSHWDDRIINSKCGPREKIQEPLLIPNNTIYRFLIININLVKCSLINNGFKKLNCCIQNFPRELLEAEIVQGRISHLSIQISKYCRLTITTRSSRYFCLRLQKPSRILESNGLSEGLEPVLSQSYCLA